MEKKAISVDQVKENFSINGEQAESVIRQLETIGVLGSKNEDGTHTVMMDKDAFINRVRGYQDLAERMRAVAASKNANLSDVTISKKLIIEENDHAVKTRVPGTWGEEARYVWLRKENIMEIHGGKTMPVSYTHLVFWLLDFAGYRRIENPVKQPLVHQVSQKQAEERKPFVLPEPAGDNSYLISYLNQERGISKMCIRDRS